MRAKEFIREGGWEDTITQKTKLNPAIVKAALAMVKQLTADFNKYLEAKGEMPVKMGHPLGSTAYYLKDKPDAEYGDIDMQMIAPDLEGKSAAQLAKHYNDLLNDFVTTTKPAYLYDKGKPTNGHPIFKLNDDTYVQVDMLWSPGRLSDWNRWRMTPMQGVKGLIYGNLYSALGEIMNMSLQSSVLMKVKDGEPVNYQKSRKVDDVIEITKNIDTFGLDILKFVYGSVYGSQDNIKVDPLLSQHPGLNRESVQISDLVKMIVGLARSFEDNDLYGKYNLKDFMNEDDFINTFLKHYDEKAHKAGTGTKLDKASTPEELAKVQQLRDKIAKGQKLVHQEFAKLL